MIKKIIFLLILLCYFSGYLYSADTANLLIIYQKGIERYRTSDYKGALEFWLKALEEAKIQNKIQAIGVFAASIGSVYSRLQDYPKALDYFQQSLKIKRETGDRIAEGNSLGDIGIIYDEINDYPKALDYFQQSLKIKRETGDRIAEGKQLHGIGNVYFSLKDYPKALDYFQQSLKIFIENGGKIGEVKPLSGIGNIYNRLGDYPKALDYFQQSLKITKESGNRMDEETLLNNIGNIYARLGDYPKALEYYQQSLKIAKEIGDKKGESRSLNNTGKICHILEDYPKALDYFQQSLKITKEIGVIDTTAEGNIGDIYLEQEKMSLAYEIYNKIGHSIRLGRYYLAMNENAKAKDKFMGYLLKAEKIKDLDILLSNYIGLALSCEGIKEYNESAKYFKKAFDIVEEKRSMLTESQRMNFFAVEHHGFSHIDPNEGLVRITMFTEGGYRGSLYFAESTRSRLFTEMVAKKYGIPETRISQNVAAKETELSNNIASCYEKMKIAFEKNINNRYQELEIELSALKKEQESFIATLRKDYPEYASVMYPEPVYVENVPLKQDEVIIEYEVTEPYAKLFVVKSGKIVNSEDIKASRKELADIVKKYRYYFEGIQNTSQLASYDPNVGKKLYDLLLKPVLEAKDDNGNYLVPKNSKIIIVPDEILGILPFESLVMSLNDQLQMPSGKYGPVPTGVKYVGNDYDITYYQSATALTTQRRLKKEGKIEKSLFVLADPIFDLSDSRAKNIALTKLARNEYQLKTMGAVVKQMGIGGARGADNEAKVIAKEEEISFPRLDKTSILAQDLEKKIFDGESVDILTGISANEKELKQKDLSQYKYLVFATHGILDNTVPYIKEPALVLNQLGTDDENDGFLTMNEVMGLKLNADIVALTACQTGLGKNVSGEGVMGLGRAFQYAGAKSVLVSLWSVGEESTTMLAEKFFQYLKQGKSKRESIRLARADIRREGYEHPFFWSPFILIGD